jgi:hypothetical protein
MKKLNVGDVFTIPLDDKNDSRVGFGQIIKIPNKHNFIIVVFKQIFCSQDFPSIDKIIEDKILFLGYTMDALIYHKYWQIIGNKTSNLAEIKLPYYKLGTPPDMNIVDYQGNIFRSASKSEFDNLEYKTVAAPVRYENALKAYYKMAEWDDDYDELLYERTLESIEAVEENNDKKKGILGLWKIF